MFPGYEILVPVLNLYFVCFLFYVCCCVLFLCMCCFCMYLFSYTGFIIGTWLFIQHANKHLMYYYYYYYYYYPLSPLCRVVTNKQLKNPMFLGNIVLQLLCSYNIVLQLFCGYNPWHMYCYFRCYMFCTFTLVISDVYE
jgi:hypothetical protein